MDLLKPLYNFYGDYFFRNSLFQIYINPFAKRTIKETQIKLAESFFENPISPKKPVALTETFYLYVAQAEKKNSEQYLKRVILLERKSPKEKGIYLAKEASMNLNKGNFLLQDGFVFIITDYKNTNILKFKEYALTISREFLKKPDFYIKRGEMTFSELKENIKTSKPGSEKYYRYLSEYYQRIFYAFTVLPLLLQAILLGLIFKPQNRFLLFFTGLAIYLLFYFLYNFFISLGENGKINPLYSHLYFNGFLFLLIFLEFKFLKNREFSL